MLQWLSSILGKNISWAGDSNHQPAVPKCSMQTSELLGVNIYSAELTCFELFNKKRKPKCCYLTTVVTIACNNLANSADQDQTARSVQSGLDLHCPQKQLNLVRALQGLNKVKQTTEQRIQVPQVFQCNQHPSQGLYSHPVSSELSNVPGQTSLNPPIGQYKAWPSDKLTLYFTEHF